MCVWGGGGAWDSSSTRVETVDVVLVDVCCLASLVS